MVWNHSLPPVQWNGKRKKLDTSMADFPKHDGGITACHGTRKILKLRRDSELRRSCVFSSALTRNCPCRNNRFFCSCLNYAIGVLFILPSSKFHPMSSSWRVLTSTCRFSVPSLTVCSKNRAFDSHSRSDRVWHFITHADVLLWPVPSLE